MRVQRSVRIIQSMIRKLKSGEYRLYSRKKNPKTGRRRNLGTFKTLTEAKRHERAVQFFKRHQAESRRFGATGLLHLPRWKQQ